MMDNFMERLCPSLRLICGKRRGVLEFLSMAEALGISLFLSPTCWRS